MRPTARGDAGIVQGVACAHAIMVPFTLLCYGVPMVLRFAPLLLLMPLLSACVASAAIDVLTAPVKIVSKTADIMTTSQSEADEKRGRALRQRDERLGELSRDYAKAQRRCADGKQQACDDLARIDREMAALRTAPY